MRYYDFLVLLKIFTKEWNFGHFFGSHLGFNHFAPQTSSGTFFCDKGHLCGLESAEIPFVVICFRLPYIFPQVVCTNPT